MPHTTFESLGLIDPLLRAVRGCGYEVPTPIQAQAIPQLLEGHDLLGIAQTGSGKTAAFVLPILQQLASPEGRGKPHAPRALVLAPTRELAIQIGDGFRDYGRGLKLHHTVIFGGVSQHPQTTALSRRIDIVVATPGRLLDLMEQGHIRLDRISHFVLDEADRMLDMGFIHDVEKVLRALPKRRHSLFFSATMPGAVAKLANRILVQPRRVEVTPQSTTVETVEQSVYFARQAEKPELLTRLLEDPSLSKVLVFARTKHRANKVAEHLTRSRIEADAIHGNKSQGARQRALERFRSSGSRVLVATDIAARGIDVEAVSHVINYELPNEPESYVHRIGRTARAGAAGSAISFCDHSEVAYLRDIEKLIGLSLRVDGEQRYDVEPAAPPRGNGYGQRQQGSRPGGPPRNRSRNRRRRRGGYQRSPSQRARAA